MRNALTLVYFMPLFCVLAFPVIFLATKQRFFPVFSGSENFEFSKFTLLVVISLKLFLSFFPVYQIPAGVNFGFSLTQIYAKTEEESVYEKRTASKKGEL